MKKIKIFTTFTLIALVVGAVVLHSCKKENPLHTQSQQTNLTEQDIQINNAIANFLAKVDYHRESPGYKSEESLSIDSAIWYIDAAINYTYAIANHPFAQLHRDTSFIEMGVLESYEAAITEVVEAYDGTISKFSQKYHAIEGENKQFIMANVEDMGPLPENKQSLRIITITGTGTFGPGGDFEEDEAYLFDRDATIDCFYGIPSSGAPIIFETYLNNHYNAEPTGNWHWAFIGYETVVVFYYQDHQLNTTLTNYLDYKIFAASDAVETIDEETECLEWNQDLSGNHEMQFYYDYLKELIDEWMASGQNTGNLNYTPLSIIESDDVTNQYSIRIISHIPKIHFKRRVKAYTEVNEPPIEE